LRCDNKGPTVTVIKCTDGYVFGGFTSTAWASRGVEASADAFIFSLHRPGGVGPVKLAVKAAKDGIFDIWVCGPSFGMGDIRVLSGANIDERNFSTIHSYELPPGHPPVDDETFFTGARRFRAAEVEVFRVRA